MFKRARPWLVAVLISMLPAQEAEGRPSAVLYKAYPQVRPYTDSQVRPYTDDKERLERAIQYFQSGKFHEALLLFVPLSKKYTLSKRTIAYMGVCSYYEHDYKMAADCFAQSAQDMERFAPQERAVYYFCQAESLFQLKRYAEALPVYETFTMVCHPNERGEAFFKTALCHAECGQWAQAQFFLSCAKDCNEVYPTFSHEKTLKMNELAKVCQEKLQNGTTFAK